jgi:hypothetical protein
MSGAGIYTFFAHCNQMDGIGSDARHFALVQNWTEFDDDPQPYKSQAFFGAMETSVVVPGIAKDDLGSIWRMRR